MDRSIVVVGVVVGKTGDVVGKTGGVVGKTGDGTGGIVGSP